MKALFSFYLFSFFFLFCSCEKNDKIFIRPGNLSSKSLSSKVNEDSYPRAPDKRELEYLLRQFPKLDSNSIILLNAPSDSYNCIGFSIGLYEWINPPDNRSFREMYYHTKCFLGAPRNYRDSYYLKATVDGFLNGLSPTHASVYIDPRWMSKLGSSWLIAHNREGLNGSLYGDISVHFEPNPLPCRVDHNEFYRREVIAYANSQVVELTSEEKIYIAEEAQSSSSLKKNFLACMENGRIIG